MPEFEVASATEAKFASAIEWAADEGWNPGLDDLAAFHAADPQGFLLGRLDGEPVTSISVVRYGRGFGFLGFYIAKPGLRGKGYGWQTWQAGLKHLSGRIVGLDGVVAQQDNYRKSGFVLAGRNVRYSGILPDFKGEPSFRVEPITTATLEDAIAYDRAFFPDNREDFMRQWLLATDSSRRRGVVARDDGKIRGIGVVRQCRNGYKIGPLFADHQDLAETIFVELCRALPSGTTVTIDVPEDNRVAVALAESFGMAATFETARMYKGPPPELPIDRTFGVTTFELG